MPKELWDEEHSKPLRRRWSAGRSRNFWFVGGARPVLDPDWIEDWTDILKVCATGGSLTPTEVVPAASGDSYGEFLRRYPGLVEKEGPSPQQLASWARFARQVEAGQREWEEAQRRRQDERERQSAAAWAAKEAPKLPAGIAPRPPLAPAWPSRPAPVWRGVRHIVTVKRWPVGSVWPMTGWSYSVRNWIKE